ncbi:Gldg family protein [Curvivirga sp.]|uniref:Gldg family protein n=1 Tax=Curvivirga sp. TaxID=2856848 RepID=UPI003B5C9DC3
MMLWIQRKPLLAAFFAIVAFVVVNLASEKLSSVRLDLTDEKLFTLSEGSEVVLSKMQDRPVQVTFYYSTTLGKEIPTYGAFASRVRDMLKEFEVASNGGMILREIDPKPFSAEEDEAVENGMEGLPLEAGGDKVYFGMSVVYADEAGDISGSPDGEGPIVSAIPFFQIERETFLEYDMMKAIYTIGNPDLPVVGVITETTMFGDPYAQMQGQQMVPWAAIGQAQDFFQIEQISRPEDFLDIQPDILLVAHPGNLHDDMQYAIDQFMMRGGKAVFMMDPWFESKGNGYAPDRSDGSAEKLFTKWGIEIAETQVVGDKNIARQVNGGTDGQVFAAPYIIWLQPELDNLNQNDPTLADVDNLLLPSAGAIMQSEGSSLVMEPLITTTSDAKLVPISELRERNVMKLLEDYQAGEEAPYVVAARFHGKVDTAFPEGEPPLTEDQLAEIEEERKALEEAGEPVPERVQRYLEHKASSDGDINVILIADADFMADRFWVRVQDFFGQQVMTPFADNGAFMLGMLESLNGSGELMSLRSRGISARPFTVISDIQRKAEEEFRAQEQMLSARLIEIEQQLAELQGGGDANLVGEAKEETEQAIEAFTQDMLDIRQELRSVNLALREDIEALEANIKFVNIALVPILIAIVAIMTGVIRRRRYR